MDNKTIRKAADDSIGRLAAERVLLHAPTFIRALANRVKSPWKRFVLRAAAAILETAARDTGVTQ